MKARLQRLLVLAVFAGAVVAAALLLWSVWSAFTSTKFSLFDYGIYANIIWNSGHGDFFVGLHDRSYLWQHLSFSLALLGPLARAVGHPFFLSALQWLMLMAAPLILLCALPRPRFNSLAAAALVFFAAGYVFTQRVALSEFHGTSLYFVAVPWLYLACVRRHPIAWLPLLVILGVREDAFLFVLPLLVYFGWAEDWKPARLMLAAALVYGVLALLVLYPWINGLHIFERRQESLSATSLLDTWNTAGLKLRGLALLLTLVPALLVARRRAWAALFFPSVALLTSLLSGFWRQHGLINHYSAPVMIMLVTGMVESLRRSARQEDGLSPPRPWAEPLRMALLMLWVLVIHHQFGFTWGGARHLRYYQRPNPEGLALLEARRHAPPAGILVTDYHYAPYFAHRRSLLTWEYVDESRHQVDVVADRFERLPNLGAGRILSALRAGEFGISYFDGRYFIATRGASPDRNPEVLFALDAPELVISVADTEHQHGQDRRAPACRRARYWDGRGHRAPADLSHGKTVELAAGRYEILVRQRVRAPERSVRGNRGMISLHRPGSATALLESEIEVGTRDEFQWQSIPFEVATPSRVEFRATAGDAEWWLDRIYFKRLEPETESSRARTVAPVAS